MSVDSFPICRDRCGTDYSEVPRCFSWRGIGLLEDALHLEVDKVIPPVKMPVRKVPLSVQQTLKNEIDRLLKLDILAPVDTPTGWISTMVVVQKSNGKIRLCIDSKPLNKVLKRNHYFLPVIDDLLPRLANAKVFSVVDAKNGFWHVPLDAESSYLTTFATPWGVTGGKECLLA